MVPCRQPSFCSTVGLEVANPEWKELGSRQVARKSTNYSDYGFYSFAFVILILLQLEIFIIPFGAAQPIKNVDGYLIGDDNDDQQQRQTWSGRFMSLISQQERSNGDISNVTLLSDKITFDKWKQTESVVSDRQPQVQSEFILFTFTVNRNGKTGLLIPTAFAGYYTIELEAEEELIVTCRASLLGLGDDMDVMWWKDNEFLPTANSSLSIKDDESLGLYRCVADVGIISTDLLDSYLPSNHRVKRSTEMPPGKVLSNAIIVKRAVPLHFIVHPKNTTVINGSVFRLECVTTGSKYQPIIWLKNKAQITVNNTKDKIHIYTVENQSVLHLLGAEINDSGHYRCRSGDVFSDEAIVTIIPEEDVNLTRNLVFLKELPSELSIPVGESVILECLSNNPQSFSSWHAVNEYGQPNKKYETRAGESRSALVISLASAEDGGRYTCTLSGKTLRHTASTIITVQEAPFLFVERSVKRITGALGTTTRLRCSASVEPQDTSFQIIWYKDGKRVLPFGRIKLQPVEGFASEIVINEMGVSMVEFTKDLLLSNVQQTDEGLYQCIASNAVGERSAFIGLVVEAEIDFAITNLRVTVDHKNAQFNLQWHLPQRMNYLDAQRSVFLLNYYLSDGGSANNVPLRDAHCTPDNWCVAKCCSPNYVFFARRNYTFQMSLLKMDIVGKITPLSEHVTAVSWDGVSQKALDLIISRPNKENLEIAWERPSIEIANGIVQKYSVEYYSDYELVHEVKQRDVPLNTTSFLLNDVVSGVVYRFRVIPVTRRGSPSSVSLKSNANYTFIGYTADSAHENLEPDIGSLPFDVEQKGTSITIRWKNTRSTSNYTIRDEENQAVLMRYAPSDTLPLKEKAEEALFVNGGMSLNGKFDTFRTYQFCSRLYVGLFHGSDFCRTYRLLPVSFRDVFSGLPVDLPKPVLCNNLEKKECRCEPSYEFGDAMRVIWDWPDSADEFVVHYTLTDNIIHEDDRSVITDEAFTDLPNLRSNATYRIMIEARNKMGSIEGSWFNCTTPILGQIPAPTGVMYKELNATAVRVSWNPIHPNPRWSTPVGYVIQIQSFSGPTTSAIDIPVNGISATDYVVTVQPDVLYTLQVAARSSTGELGQHSPPYLFAPSHISQNVSRSEPDDVDIKKQKVFFTKSNREGILIGIVLAVGLLTLCFGGICAHLRLKRRKLEMGFYSNVGNKAVAVPRNKNANYEMEELITQQRNDMVGTTDVRARFELNDRLSHLEARNSQSGEADAMLDTKGGEKGALPSGQDKYLRLLNDKKQLRRFRESGLLDDLAEESSLAKSHISCRKKSTKQNQRNELMKKSNHILLESKWIRPACIGTSELWTRSLPSKKQISRINSTPIRPLRARNLNRSGTSTSICENGGVTSRFLSKLVLFSDVSRRSTANQMGPLNQADSYSSIICARSASMQSNNQNGLIKQRAKNWRARELTSITTHCPCNATSIQSLAYCDVSSILNGCILSSSRDAVKIHNNNKGAVSTSTGACSSVPNLTDSGIVYDEMHPPLA